MHFEDCFTTFYIRFINRYLPVETTRSQQCAIKHIGSVGCCKNDDTRISRETIHFNEQLVQSIFSFVVAHDRITSACTTNCIYFINENYTWCFLSCCFKQITNTTCTNSYKQFNKIATTHAEERNLCFASHCF